MALLLAAACHNDDSDITVQVGSEQTPAALQDPSRLRIVVLASGVGYEITGSQLTREGFPTLHSRTLSLPHRGMATVMVTLVDPPADTLGRITTSFPLDANFHYGVYIQPGGARPLSICVSKPASAPLRRPGSAVATDTLWVATSGLPDGAVC